MTDSKAQITPAAAQGAGRRSSVALSLVTLGSYVTMVAAAAALPELMSRRPFSGPFSLAMALGAAQMLLILLATGLYIRAANRRDAEALKS